MARLRRASACWCSARPTRPATPPRWAPSSSRASATSPAPPCRGCCRRPMRALQAEPAPAAPPLSAPLTAYLEHARVQRRLAQRSLQNYIEALTRLQVLAEEDGVELLRLQPQQARPWVA